MFFWHSFAFSMIPRMLAVWSLFPLPFLNQAWTSGSSWLTYYWSLAWRILSITLLACEMSAVAWTFFCIAFLWDWNENWPFPALWPLLNFPNLLAYWVSTLTASSLKIWNSSSGIPSPPLALFVVMLPTSLWSQSPLDFAFQDVWIYVSDHTIMVIWIMKIFFFF